MQEESWVRTEDSLPERPEDSNDYHIYCYIVVGRMILERPWNYEHECWDDAEGDDFQYAAYEASHWQPMPQQPSLPKELQ